MKEKYKFSLLEILFLMAMFCFSISLFNKAGYIFAFSSVIVLFLNVDKIKINVPLLLLMAFSVLYFSFYTHWNGYIFKNIICFLVGPWAAYIMGRIFVENSKNERAFVVLMITLALGMFLHGVLNWITYLRSALYSFHSYYRLSVDVWRNEEVNVNATGLMYVFATGISLGVLFSKLQKRYKIVAAAVVLASAMLSAFFANRALILSVMLILTFKILVRAFSKNVPNRKKIITIVVLTAAVLFSTVAFSFNLMGITDWFFSLKVVQRAGDSGRLDVWLSLFRSGDWIKYPFGAPNPPFRHNLWLDIYSAAGVLPFVLFAILTVYFIRRFFVFRSIAIERGENDTYEIFQCLCISFFLNCAIEPIIEGNPYYFMSILMFMGAMEGYITIINKNNC